MLRIKRKAKAKASVGKLVVGSFLILVMSSLLLAACGDSPNTLPDGTTAGGQGQGQVGLSTASSTNLLKKLLGKWEAVGRFPLSTVVTPGEEVEFRADNFFLFDKDNLEKSPRYQVTGSEQAGKLLLDYSYQRVLYNFQLSADGNTLRLAKADTALPTGVTFPYTLRRVQEVAPSVAALTRADGVWEKTTIDKTGTCLDQFWSFSRSKFVFGADGTFKFGALPASATSPIPPLRTGKYTLTGSMLTLTYTGKIDPSEKTDRVFSANCQVKLTQTKLMLLNPQAASSATVGTGADADISPTTVWYVQTADK